MRILLIQRAERFSPNSVKNDKAILQAVGTNLTAAGHEVVTISESALKTPLAYDVIFTMGRELETLQVLKALKGVRVINRPEGIENCARTKLESIMAQIDTPVPPKEDSEGYWLKRGDAAAQSQGDVQFAPTKAELEAKISEFLSRGIMTYTVSAHVMGDVVKFYGVLGANFFRYYYPTDDGQSKFGDEARNGLAHHYPFSAMQLQYEAERLAKAVGVEVFGGDAIIRSDGTFCVIDFNDWPSFSRCRPEAACTIAFLANKK
jgi:hypothetical protein